MNSSSIPAGRVMLGESIRCQHIREERIAKRFRIRIVWPLFLLCRGIHLLVIQRILDHRFQRLVMCGQRAIFQAAGHIKPTHAIRMQRERTRPAQPRDSYPGI